MAGNTFSRVTYNRMDGYGATIRRKYEDVEIMCHFAFNARKRIKMAWASKDSDNFGIETCELQQ